jgi:hypothetical protein
MLPNEPNWRIGTSEDQPRTFRRLFCSVPALLLGMASLVATKADYERTPGCTLYHGARGSLDQAKFAVKKRREIRYMERLRNSKEFKEAMEGYRKD